MISGFDNQLPNLQCVPSPIMVIGVGGGVVTVSESLAAVSPGIVALGSLNTVSSVVSETGKGSASLAAFSVQAYYDVAANDAANGSSLGLASLSAISEMLKTYSESANGAAFGLSAITIYTQTSSTVNESANGKAFGLSALIKN